MEAHRKGVLHRAFSVFIFNDKGELLLQQRAGEKYHSGGLWTNTCCSHPRPGEDTLMAAKRRLKEEMGIETSLQFKSAFTYKTRFANDLTEHEYDHIFTGVYNGGPIINKEEVQDYCWKHPSEIKSDIKKRPSAYTSWFLIAMERLFL